MSTPDADPRVEKGTEQVDTMEDDDTLPALDDAFPLEQATIDGFGSDGHTVVRGLAARDEVAAFRPVIESRAVDLAWDKRPLEERDTYGKAFLQSLNLWRADDTIRHFVMAPRFARVAAELLGVDGVRLYHDQALLKEPGGGPTPWHQDQHYWPLDTDHTITMWMPLVDISHDVGSMTFVSGSHQIPDLRGPGISDESQDAFAQRLDDLGRPLVTHGAMSAGDATFHAGWTVHSAGANPARSMRSVMTVIYFADGARIADPQNDAQELDRKLWLGRGRPGDIADGDDNPLLWPR